MKASSTHFFFPLLRITQNVKSTKSMISTRIGLSSHVLGIIEVQ